MSFSMYDASVKPMRHMLRSLSTVLSKGAAHCETKKIDPNALLQSRLYPDMFPLVRQVQIASDSAKGAAARLAGVEVPKFEDTETTFAELQARIDKTIAFMDTLKPEQFVGAEDRQVVLQLRDRSLEFKGGDFLGTWANPNFFFHVTTAYALLRHGGVEIGKGDFLGG
jgi:hypothetical protein